MKQPEGFAQPGKEHLICKLKRSLCGLKQSPRCWNSKLGVMLKMNDFAQTSADPCVYISKNGDLVATYVDDRITGAKKDEWMERLKKMITDAFGVRDMGELHSFLGVNVKFFDNGKWIGQPGYITDILKTFNMSNCKSVGNPMCLGKKLTKDMD